MQDSYTANTEIKQDSIEAEEDTSHPGDVRHEEVHADSDPRDVRLEMVRLHPPRRPGMKIAFGKGRMKSWDGKAFQVVSETKGGVSNFRALANSIKEEMEAMPPGQKFNAPCIYTGVPRLDGSCKASNFWFSVLGALDLDGTIRNQEEFDLLCRILAPYECILLPTASHDPENGIWRFRVIVVLTVAIEAWDLYAAVGEWLLAQVAMGLGIRTRAEALSRGMDLCTKKPFQPMLIPRFPSLERKRQAIKHLRIFHGDPISPKMDTIQRKLEEHRGAKSQGVRASTICIEDDGSIDRLASALSDLERSDLASLRPGEGRSDAGLWRAACVFRDWGVPEDTAMEQMLSRYVPLGHEESRIQHKVSSAYERTDDPRCGWRLRAASTGAVTLTQIARVGENGTDESLNRERDSSVPSSRKGITTYAERWQRALTQLPARVIYRKAPQGTGKTETLLRLMGQFRAELSAGAKRVVLLVHRVSLAKNLSRRLGLPYYKDPNMVGQIEGSCVICLDSIGRVALQRDGGDGFFVDLPIDVLIIDESEQVIRHLFGETIERKFAAVWSHLRSIFHASKSIILQDADLGRVTVDAARIFLGWEEGPQRDEHFEINEWRCGRTMRWQADEATLQRDLLAAVKEGGKHAVYCTSKTFASALVETLKEETGRRILGITAETSGSGDAFEVLEDPSEAHLKWDVIVYTGSANTGITIDVKGVWHVWGFIRGGAGPTEKDALQGLCRVRHPAGDVRVWVGGRDNSIWWGTNPEKNLADLLAKNDRTKKIVSRVSSWEEKYIRDAAESYFNVHNLDALRLVAIVMAEEAGSVDMVDAFRRHVEASGWVIVEEGKAPDEERAEATVVIRAGREMAEEIRRERIKKAEVRSIEAAKARVDAGGTPDDHAALEAAIIRDFYGLRRDEGITDDLLERDDKGRYRSQVRTFARVLLLQRGHVQAVMASAVRAAKADPTGVTWDHKGAAADLLVRVWGIFGISDLEKDAEAGTVIQIPQDLPMGPETRERFRRELGLRAPSILGLMKAQAKDGTDAEEPDSHQNMTLCQNGTDESLKEREDSSVPISHKQWGYLVRQAAAKKGITITWEQVRSGPDRGKRIGRLNLDSVRRVLQDAQRYIDRLLAGMEWKDPLIADIPECHVTLEDLLVDSDFMDLAPSPVVRTEENEGHHHEMVTDKPEEPEDLAWSCGMIEALLE